ncbi:MAG: hypothetical protein ACE5H7_04550 [Acidiferrobacterales bacterium]
MRPLALTLATILLWGSTTIAIAITTEKEAAPEAKSAPPQAEDGQMDNARLRTLIDKVGEDVTGRVGFWQFKLEGYSVLVITDESADRMRIISPITRASALSETELMRITQANFDSALDARYAVARDTLWSAFLHPLRSLTDTEFLSGLGQVVNLVATYGKSYSSGALVFGGGDSEELNRERYEKILRKGQSI